MPRKKRPLDRDGGIVRDASLMVIASEDTYAVKVYFSRFRTRQVQFRVLSTEDGKSSPKDVVDRLNEFKKEFQTLDGDQFWYCGDLDHWAQSGHIANFTEALRLCRQADYHIAISNPCFELWLLLHFADLDASHSAKGADVEAQLSANANGYSKRIGCMAAISPEMVHDAIRRSKALDVTPADVIPQVPTTRVYLIVEELLKRDSIDLI